VPIGADYRHLQNWKGAIMLGDNTTYSSFSVNDYEVAKDFYCNKLGFKLLNEQQSAGVMTLESGAGTRAIVYYKPDHKAWNATVLGIEVADIDAALEQAKAAGVSPEAVDGMTGDDGVMRDPEMGDAFWFKDPSENWIIVGRFAAASK
jgi:catechol 2,3-dioxygenase-like lactoylglutathione lyase family enzyme